MLNFVSDCNSHLKQQLSVISRVIPNGSEVAMVDEPVHRNIGDHLIHLGIEKYFQEHSIKVVTRAHTHSYHYRWFRRHIDKETIIVCHGGGHLGDLYPAHQRLREQVTKDFPSQRIVVLPQSLYFQDPGGLQQAGRVFGQHPDFHLFIRDNDSMRLAETMGLKNLYLAPDMAHALHPFDQFEGAEPSINNAQRERSLCLLRQDKESAQIDLPIGGHDTVCDWPDLVRWRDACEVALVAATYRATRFSGPPSHLDDRLDRARLRLVRRAVALYSEHRSVTTSRLHGMILGILTGKKIRLLPSLTGKSHCYYATWLKDTACADFIDAL
ncbi:polysaccharide pyruvyl transferase family protein [Thiosocius teredinicola]|uniref:polysaccharide pyruvyl transferase family protein n=1 Tax=Thiosocius teredinicola TaxID=1973002 RepID=UPI00099130B8